MDNLPQTQLWDRYAIRRPCTSAVCRTGVGANHRRFDQRARIPRSLKILLPDTDLALGLPAIQSPYANSASANASAKSRGVGGAGCPDGADCPDTTLHKCEAIRESLGSDHGIKSAVPWADNEQYNASGSAFAWGYWPDPRKGYKRGCMLQAFHSSAALTQQGWRCRVHRNIVIQIFLKEAMLR